MTGAEVLAWIVIGWFLIGTTWDVVDPEAVVLKFNSWPRALVGFVVQISAIVAAAHVLALSTAACITLVAFFIIAVLLLILRRGL